MRIRFLNIHTIVPNRQLVQLAVTVLAAMLVTACAQPQFERRDTRFYYRAPWNFMLHDHLSELDREFNGVDFGHSHLYESLLLTGGNDVPAIEEKARQETLRFIESRPVLPPNEEAIAPNYMKLAWRAQNTFNEAHALHRATYDIYASDYPDKDDAVRRVLAHYRNSPYALTTKPLDHQQLDRFPYSKAFRRKFPLFNATIWSYHYLQIVVYDPLQVVRDLPAKQRAVQPILATYHHYLKQPPVEWTFMPLTAEYSPTFAAQYPELANIFDNLHMLHDNISDILVSPLLPTWEAKREEIYRILDSYYLAKADAGNPMIRLEPGHQHPSSAPSSQLEHQQPHSQHGAGQ